MFSIVIYDKVKINFFQRCWSKTFILLFINNDLIVSSEIKDRFIYQKKKKNKIKENKKVVFKYLLRGWCNDNINTFFHNIFEFSAGTYSIVGENKTH